MSKSAILVGIYMAASVTIRAQQDSTKVLREVTVTGLRDTEARFSTLNIISVRAKDIEERGSLNLSDALSKIPGISQMTTGFAISKPVIRGLYGNRILILLSGLRFDNQQFQDEHGMGLSYIGIQRTEIIKGPASILYGTDALGGVINIVEEQVDPNIKKYWDVNTRFYSNTLGTITDVGYKRNRGTRWFRIRGGYESHADYSDGHNSRVLNSRANGYYLKSGWGATRGNWQSENTYNLSYNNYGFIVEDLKDFFSADQRWSRKMNGPHHMVALNIFSSRNRFQLKNSVLQLNCGVQSNMRLEDESGGQISLFMHSLSGLANGKWEKKISESNMFIANGQMSLESNKNYGSRIIVPDAGMFEINGSGFLRHSAPRWIVEGGLGVGNKSIKTFETKDLNSPDKEIHPFSINRVSINTLGGISFFPTDYLTVKSNIGTGYRAPNLAELSSDGLHEGTSRYEIGDPHLGIEHNINSDLTIELKNQSVLFYVSGYYNEIYNYVYLAPTSDNYFGFQIYRYRQQDSHLLGGEVMLQVYLEKWLQFKNSFVLTRGLIDQGGYLPFIPAKKWTSSFRFEKVLSGKVSSFYAEPEFVYVASQNSQAQFETATGSYSLANFYLGVVIPKGKSNLIVSLSGQNLFSKAYADHLSRLKYYGILNPGRNITVNLHIPLTTILN